MLHKVGGCFGKVQAKNEMKLAEVQEGSEAESPYSYLRKDFARQTYGTTGRSWTSETVWWMYKLAWEDLINFQTNVQNKKLLMAHDSKKAQLDAIQVRVKDDKVAKVQLLSFLKHLLGFLLIDVNLTEQNLDHTMSWAWSR